MPDDDEDLIQPIKSGVRTFGDDDSVAYRWMLFNKQAAEAWAGHALDLSTAREASDTAGMLTGWYYSYGGPGRVFSDVPMIKVVRNHILVIQRTGWDI